MTATPPRSRNRSLHALEIRKVFMKLYFSTCLFCLGTVVAMGAGSGGGEAALVRTTRCEKRSAVRLSKFTTKASISCTPRSSPRRR